jgi:hypothetical protein
MSAMQLPDVTAEQFLRAVRDGVSDAMWQMMTNATDMPCHDFYEMVKSRHQGSRLHGEQALVRQTGGARGRVRRPSDHHEVHHQLAGRIWYSV